MCGSRDVYNQYQYIMKFVMVFIIIFVFMIQMKQTLNFGLYKNLCYNQLSLSQSLILLRFQ